VSGVPTWLAIAAVVTGPLSAGYAMWRGTRDKAVNAAVAEATRPFTTGKEVASEAEIVLAMRGAALEESQRQQGALREKNAELQAQNTAQAKQIDDLFTRVGRLTAKNAELQEQLAVTTRTAQERELQDRARIGELEEKLGEVLKQLGMGA
jgi:chromosome segregation ATPase